MANIEIPINEMNINGAFVGDEEYSAVFTLTSDVVDGEKVYFGNECYEFDTNSSVTGSNILVDVSGGTGSTNAMNRLTTAVSQVGTIAISKSIASNSAGFLIRAKSSIGMALTDTCVNGSFDRPSLTANKWMFASNFHSYYMPNDGKTYIEIGNASGGDLTVTFEAVKKCSHGVLHNLVVVVPNATTKKYGSFDMNRFNQTSGLYTGAVKITISAGNVRLTAYRIP
jgi:hypothetical protein